MVLFALDLPPGSFTSCPLVLVSREALAAEETNSGAAEAAAAHGPKLFFPHHTPILLGAQSLAPPWSVGVKVLGSQPAFGGSCRTCGPLGRWDGYQQAEGRSAS